MRTSKAFSRLLHHAQARSGKAAYLRQGARALGPKVAVAGAVIAGAAHAVLFSPVVLLDGPEPAAPVTSLAASEAAAELEGAADKEANLACAITGEDVVSKSSHGGSAPTLENRLQELEAQLEAQFKLVAELTEQAGVKGDKLRLVREMELRIRQLEAATLELRGQVFVLTNTLEIAPADLDARLQEEKESMAAAEKEVSDKTAALAQELQDVFVKGNSALDDLASTYDNLSDQFVHLYKRARTCRKQILATRDHLYSFLNSANARDRHAAGLLLCQVHRALASGTVYRRDVDAVAAQLRYAAPNSPLLALALAVAAQLPTGSADALPSYDDLRVRFQEVRRATMVAASLPESPTPFQLLQGKAAAVTGLPMSPHYQGLLDHSSAVLDRAGQHVEQQQWRDALDAVAGLEAPLRSVPASWSHDVRRRLLLEEAAHLLQLLATHT